MKCSEECQGFEWFPCEFCSALFSEGEAGRYPARNKTRAILIIDTRFRFCYSTYLCENLATND